MCINQDLTSTVCTVLQLLPACLQTEKSKRITRGSATLLAAGGSQLAVPQVSCTPMVHGGVCWGSGYHSGFSLTFVAPCCCCQTLLSAHVLKLNKTQDA